MSLLPDLDTTVVNLEYYNGNTGTDKSFKILTSDMRNFLDFLFFH